MYTCRSAKALTDKCHCLAGKIDYLNCMSAKYLANIRKYQQEICRQFIYAQKETGIIFCLW